MQMVERARAQVRILEAATQALYDDGMSIFIDVQSLGRADLLDPKDRASIVTSAEATAPIIRSNCMLAAQTLETLLAIGHDQASISQGDYRNSIEWRRSRINMADTSMSIDALTSRLSEIPADDDEYVNMEQALGQSRMIPAPDPSRPPYGSSQPLASQSSLDMSDRTHSESVNEPETPTWSNPESADESTLISPVLPEVAEEPVPFPDDDDRK